MRILCLQKIQQYKSTLLLRWENLCDKVRQYGFRALVLAMVLVLLWQKDLSFQLDLSAAPHLAIHPSNVSSADISDPSVAQAAISLDFLNDLIPIKVVEKTKVVAPKTSIAEQQNLSNTYSNMDFEEKKKTPKAQNNSWQLKRKKQEAYVQRFAKVAQAEMDKYQIPASITLAQGLIESNAGDSRLSRKNNNHFGMKCFSKKCKKGHCSNFTDDSHKDFFRIYQSSWESYRAHSHLLTGKRYRHLKKHGKDYKSWAHGLKKAGYATDKKYGQKLIHLIERLNLHQYDQ